jgi:kynurenine formamidase
MSNVSIFNWLRILFKTRNSTRAWSTNGFCEDFVYISKEAAAFLAKAGVRKGVVSLSVGGFHKDSVETHETGALCFSV